MRDIYLYGASDDCMECDVWLDGTVQRGWESYVGIMLNEVRVQYVFDGDWGIWLEGDVPSSWIVRSFRANCADDARRKPFGGQFIHIQIPSDEALKIVELRDDE